MDRQGLGVVSRAAHVKGGALRGAEGGRIFTKMRIFAKKTRIFYENARFCAMYPLLLIQIYDILTFLSMILLDVFLKRV